MWLEIVFEWFFLYSLRLALHYKYVLFSTWNCVDIIYCIYLKYLFILINLLNCRIQIFYFYISIHISLREVCIKITNFYLVFSQNLCLVILKIFVSSLFWKAVFCMNIGWRMFFPSDFSAILMFESRSILSTLSNNFLLVDVFLVWLFPLHYFNVLLSSFRCFSYK